MKRIILPVDFSPKTDLLLEKAIEFAKLINGKISLIHVAPNDLGYALGDVGFQYYPEIEQHEIKEELLQLNVLEQRVLAHDVDCDHYLKQGIARDVILDYAKELNADFIVMGSHGRSGMYDVFVGSLTKDLTKVAPIPVVVIPIHDSAKP